MVALYIYTTMHTPLATLSADRKKKTLNMQGKANDICTVQSIVA
jgi:hypothetical protein